MRGSSLSCSEQPRASAGAPCQQPRAWAIMQAGGRGLEVGFG